VPGAAICAAGRFVALAAICAAGRFVALAAIFTAALGAAGLAAAAVGTESGKGPRGAVCEGGRGTLYLTIDTGNMRHAEDIAATLQRHGVLATFFLANEKTFRGDYALDPAWSDYWRQRAREGHAFGTHTWRHGSFRRDVEGGVAYVPQFGAGVGRTEVLDAAGMCRELDQVNAVFREATGRALDPLWRAPGGRTTAAALRFGEACGYRHVHWAPAGFLGDELPSDRYPNDALVQRALRDLRDGDIMVMHLGIWSRRDPFAPALDPLLAGLKARGFCFATLAGTARR
jgi:peptidoglycan/xylan/chitin deacetylase (PgdA/CDA1 family)